MRASPCLAPRFFERIRAYQTKKPEAGERKFERDKDDLRTLGVIIEESNEEGDSYRISQKGYELPPIELDDDERVALILAAESLRAAEGLPYRELAEDALSQVVVLMRHDSPCVRARAGRHSLPSREKGARMRRTLAQLSGAVDGRKQVTITYAAGNADKPSERKVDPYGLIYSAGDWQSGRPVPLAERAAHVPSGPHRETEKSRRSPARPISSPRPVSTWPRTRAARHGCSRPAKAARPWMWCWMSAPSAAWMAEEKLRRRRYSAAGSRRPRQARPAGCACASARAIQATSW